MNGHVRPSDDEHSMHVKGTWLPKKLRISGMAHQHRGTEQRTTSSAHTHAQCFKHATPGADENSYILPFSHKGKRSSPNGCVSSKTNLNTTVSMRYSAGVQGEKFVEPG